MLCDQWYADGTFKVLQNVFYQLYTIHGNHEAKIIPLIFRLLPYKQKKHTSVV